MVDAGDETRTDDGEPRDGELEGDGGEDRDARDGPLDRGDQEIGATAAANTDSLLGVLPHFYRGEVSQANSAQDRIDRTTDWAITLLAALLSIVFSSRNMPAFLLLIGMFVLSIFLPLLRSPALPVLRPLARPRPVHSGERVRERPRTRRRGTSGLARGTERRSSASDVQGIDSRGPLSAYSSRVRAPVHGGRGRLAVQSHDVSPEQQWTEAAELPGIHGAVVAAVLVLFCDRNRNRTRLWPGDGRRKERFTAQNPASGRTSNGVSCGTFDYESERKSSFGSAAGSISPPSSDSVADSGSPAGSAGPASIPSPSVMAPAIG